MSIQEGLSVTFCYNITVHLSVYKVLISATPLLAAVCVPHQVTILPEICVFTQVI